MEDIEIYELASEVISTIHKDIQKIMYKPIDGKLVVRWDTRPLVNAWASSTAELGAPPQHEIGIHYELLRVVYRDIEAYFEYSKQVHNGLDMDVIENFFPKATKPIQVLPVEFDISTSIRFAFIGAITWIFYHELAHLDQEHGYIRNWRKNSSSPTIDEAIASSSPKATGWEAAVSHVTELAADFSSTLSCLVDLHHHFKGNEFLASMRLFVTGVSCLLYRFHGERSYIPSELPEGSHPTPIVRLEGILPQMWEHVDGLFNTNLSRECLVYGLSISAVSVGLFWLRFTNRTDAIPEHFFLEGHLNRPNCAAYFREIIPVWDTIVPRIIANRRPDRPLALLTFSPTFRECIGCDKPIAPQTGH